jgi:isoleucyl-tRNA synthetase
MIDESLIDGTEVVIKIVSLARSLRNEAQIKVRQPLGDLYVVVKEDWELRAIEKMSDQIQDELNIKTVRSVENESSLLDYVLKPNFKIMGRKYGSLMPEIKEQIAAIHPESARKIVDSCRSLELSIDGEAVTVPFEELSIETRPRAGLRVISEAGYTVALDIVISDELKNEGLARELIHKIQEMRKQAGFEISDRIHLKYRGSATITKAIKHHKAYISNEVLCLSLHEEEPRGDFVKSLDVNGESVKVGIARADK